MKLNDMTPLRLASEYESQADADQAQREEQWEREAETHDYRCAAAEERIRADAELISLAIVEAYDHAPTQAQFLALEVGVARANCQDELLRLACDYRALIDAANGRYAEKLAGV